jgi:hypothetical protein
MFRSLHCASRPKPPPQVRFRSKTGEFFSVSPYLEKGIFKELKSLEIFNSVKVIEGTVQWQNEADFCPDTLYLESNSII